MVASHFSFAAFASSTPIRHTPERRQYPRYELNLRVTAVITDDSDAQRHRRICSLNLLNISDTGVAVLSDRPMSGGARISLFLSPHGPEPAVQLTGTVVRQVLQSDGQHLLGIQLDRRCAA